MVIFQFDIKIYCAAKLFFPSPVRCLGSSMQTAVLMVAVSDSMKDGAVLLAWLSSPGPMPFASY